MSYFLVHEAPMDEVSVQVDDPKRDDVSALIAEHLRDMHSSTPPESVHAIGVEALTQPSVTLWSAREGDVR